MRPSPSPFSPQKSCACAPPPISKRKKGWWTSSQQAFTSHHFVDHLIIPIQSFPFINFLDYTCITNNEPLCLFHCFNRHFTGLIVFLRLLSCQVLIYSYDCNLQYFESEPYLHAYIFLSKQFYTDTCICTYVSLLKFMFSPRILCWKKVELYAFLENVKQHTYIA